MVSGGDRGFKIALLITGLRRQSCVRDSDANSSRLFLDKFASRHDTRLEHYCERSCNQMKKDDQTRTVHKRMLLA